MEVQPDPRIINRNRFTPQNLSILPKTLPNIPRGIGSIPNIPSLENIDFSNLPMGMDFTKFDPRAINANPTGFQDMIERARAQEGLQGSLGGPMEFGEARKKQ